MPTHIASSGAHPDLYKVKIDIFFNEKKNDITILFLSVCFRIIKMLEIKIMLGSYWIFVLNIWSSEVNIRERTLVFESRIKKDFSAVATLFFSRLWLLFQDLVILMWITTPWNQYNYCITAKITRWRFPMNLDLHVTTTALPYFSFY